MILFLCIVIAIGGVGLFLKKLFPAEYSWKEYGVAMGLISILTSLGYIITVNSQTSDIEILSGKVIDKKKQKVGCRHSYSCHCYTSCSGSRSSRICSTRCQTCYEHSFDNDWNINSTIGTFTINSIDRQGLKEPPRWTNVKISEPVAKQESYTNYLKAAPDSLYKKISTRKTPEYPDKIVDYYNIDRVVNDGIKIPTEDEKKLNIAISEGLKDIGIKKQVNLVFVITKETASSFAKDIQAAWLNGRKNDLVVVIGTNDYPNINWIEAFGWSSNDMALISTRDSILDYGKIDEHIVNIALENIDKYWIRKPMKDFEYLSDEIEPSTTAIIILIIVALSVMVGVSILAIKNGENNDFF